MLDVSNLNVSVPTKYFSFVILGVACILTEEAGISDLAVIQVSITVKRVLFA